MSSIDSVTFADRLSRKRPIGTAVATLAFLVIQVVVHPGFGTTGAAGRGFAWVANALVLLLLLTPMAGFVWGQRVRALVNDEIARLHARSGMAAGFWAAMIVALALFALPVSATLTAREALYLVVTPATGVALLLFSWLEWRANRDD